MLKAHGADFYDMCCAQCMQVQTTLYIAQNRKRRSDRLDASRLPWKTYCVAWLAMHIMLPLGLV